LEICKVFVVVFFSYSEIFLSRDIWVVLVLALRHMLLVQYVWHPFREL